MNFYKALDTDSSRAVADIVTEAVGDNPIYFKEVLDLALQDIPKISMRAGRVVLFCSEKHPELLKPYLRQLIKNIPKIKNEGTLRTILRLIIMFPEIKNENDISLLLEKGFDYIQGKRYSVAIKVYAMEILYNISKQYPEILNELIAVVKSQIPFSSAGFKAKAKILFGNI